MPDLEPITREEMLLDGQDLEPITRKEMFIKRIYDKTQVIPEPITREEMFLKKAGDETTDVTIEQLNVSENGTYSEEGVAYSPVIVNVPAPPIPDNAYLLNEVEGLPKDIATFTDGSNLPMPSLKVGIEPVQEGSGDPSPTNIRPISGHTEANVSDTSKNLVNWKWNTFNEGKMEIFLKGGTYTLSAESTLINGNAYIRGIKPSGEYISQEELGLTDWGTSSTPGVYYGGGGQQTYTFNVPNGGANIEFGKLNNNGTINAQLEEGSTATTYEPYNGQTYTIDLDGTRYGGEVDVVNGTMTVDRVGVDLSSVSFTYDSNNKRWSRQFSDMKNYSARSADLMFEQYQATTSAYTGDTGTAFAYGKDIYIYDANQSLTISGKCVYELATPLTIQLTPTQVKSLLGSNNVWADTGKIEELEYFSKEV